jgi:iron complex outermembrane receptor protein
MALYFALFLPLTLAAQQTGSITGTVRDPSGSALPKATVVLRSTTGNYSAQTVSDGQGRFSFNSVPAGTYGIDGSAPAFSVLSKKGLAVAAGRPLDVTLQLAVGNIAQQVVVTAADSDSIAAQQSPISAPLDEESARSQFNTNYIQQFASPVSDYGTVLEMAPGTFSISTNGVGLGQDKTYFRGFADGNYDETWDGIPYNDTNSPTHHSWAFFPSQWLGGIDFDRSPGTASTIGPTPFGGSINLLSREVPAEQSGRASVAYGSFNTLLIDGQYDSGALFGNRKSGLSLDVQRLTSDGFQTYNRIRREAGNLKFQYKFSNKLVLTAFSGWLMLDSNTPNTTTPTRTQVATLGYNYLLNNNPTSPNYFGYNGYNLPTIFSYIGLNADLGRGWKLDVKPYTYSYKNHQWYTNAPAYTGVIGNNCGVPVSGVLPCASDQLNGYHKFGEVSTISQTSHYGIFRTGMWYEWASTNRYLYPTNPLTRQFGNLPSYREYFTTSSYQPFAEYEYEAIPKLTITGGFKFAQYVQDLTQYPDNGKTIGTPPNGASAVYNTGSYHSPLPSFSANYRIRPIWSAYAQFSQGSVIPPSSVFDVKSGAVETLPKPAKASAYQGGTVLKLKRVMFDGDVYRVKFQNAYTSFTPPGGAVVYYLNPDSVTTGAEMETNVAITHDLSAYANGTFGKAQYVGSAVPGGLWVANTPRYTQGTGLTYQQRNLDLGIFQKLIGPMWSDNKSYHDQVAINPFNTVNMFLNYTVRNNTRFDQTRIGLSFNNLFNSENTIGVTPSNSAVPLVIDGAKSTYLATTAPSGNDLLTLTPGRSVMLSITFGLQRQR